jgi:hypothetical protein
VGRGPLIEAQSDVRLARSRRRFITPILQYTRHPWFLCGQPRTDRCAFDCGARHDRVASRVDPEADARLLQPSDLLTLEFPASQLGQLSIVEEDVHRCIVGSAHDFDMRGHEQWASGPRA